MNKFEKVLQAKHSGIAKAPTSIPINKTIIAKVDSQPQISTADLVRQLDKEDTKLALKEWHQHLENLKKPLWPEDPPPFKVEYNIPQNYLVNGRTLNWLAASYGICDLTMRKGYHHIFRDIKMKRGTKICLLDKQCHKEFLEPYRTNLLSAFEQNFLPIFYSGDMFCLPVDYIRLKKGNEND